MEKRQIKFEEYFDKVLGAWIGKSLGGIIGAPFESHKIKGEMTAENCWPSKIYANDDLDIQVVWLEMMEELGPDFLREDLVRYWQDRCWYNFAEYGFFLYNVQRGIQPPVSGDFNNQFYRECMGCPIRSEIWSLVCIGDPKLAAAFALWDGELDHIRNSVYAEQFWAAVEAEAFFVHSLEEALEAGIRIVPFDSDIYRIAHEVKDLWEKHRNWEKIWLLLVRQYGHRDNSKVEINFAFTLLSLYAGGGNLKDTIVVAINCGWDADCTAATAGALVGILQGASALPDDWKQRMGDKLACDVNVKYNDVPLLEFAMGTCKVGLEMMLSRRHVDIVDIPSDIMNEVNNRWKRRLPGPIVHMKVSYPEGPVLYRNKGTDVCLNIHNSGTKRQLCKLTIEAPSGLVVTQPSMDIHLMPGDNEVLFKVYYREGTEEVLDKNLLHAVLQTENEDKITHEFGLVGARQWKVYGPYWDAWDTSKWEICPYRNEEIITHPVHIPGCHRVLVHNYVDLNRPYLNEEKLLKEDLVEEEPFLVERGEDFIDAEHFGGFLGEACYYLVREIVSSEPVSCNVAFGSTEPFIAWIDGKEMIRVESSGTWGVVDHRFAADFGLKPRRLVVKIMKQSDRSRFSMCFLKSNVPGDKKKGHSYLVDLLGDKL